MKTTCLATLPTALEDAVRCLGALEALAASGRRLLSLSAPEVVPLLRLVPGEIESVPRLGDLAAVRLMVRGAGCTEAVILSRRLDDAWLARSAGVERRWGYRSLAGGWWLNRSVAPPSRRRRRRRPAGEDFRELLAAMDVAWRGPAGRPAIDDSLRRVARARLACAHLDPAGGPLVGIYPGVAGGGSGRPWPRHGFEELIRRWRRRHPERRFVLLATTADLWAAVRVHEETGKIHPVIGPDLKLDLLAAVLGELDLLIAADSWMLDVAASAATRTLGLYVRDPRRWAPRGEGHLALQASSLAAIDLEEVIEAAGQQQESDFR